MAAVFNLNYQLLILTIRVMNKQETQKTLDQFKDFVIAKSKANLASMNKDSSKKLSNSIDGVAKVMPNSFTLDFTMEKYGLYQDKGVSGVKKKYNTQYSYTTKMPPPAKLDKWIVRRGLAPRTSSGQFQTRKVQDPKKLAQSIQWIIARGIFYNGIKPSLFFTKPFEQAYKELPDEVAEAYGLDVENFMEFSLKDI